MQYLFISPTPLHSITKLGTKQMFTKVLEYWMNDVQETLLKIEKADLKKDTYRAWN